MALSAIGKVTKRARKAGDTATVARKRYYRAAERELKRAEGKSGAAAMKSRQLARQYFEDALSTYDPTRTQAFSKPIQRLADEFGIDLDTYRESRRGGNLERVTGVRERAILSSGRSLESTLASDENRRELEARALLSDNRIGSRIMGGFADVWKEEATFYDETTGTLKVDNKKIMSKMMEYFEVDNYADLLEKIEAITGEKLYSDPENDMDYEAVKILIQTHIAEREYAA